MTTIESKLIIKPHDPTCFDTADLPLKVEPKPDSAISRLHTIKPSDFCLEMNTQIKEEIQPSSSLPENLAFQATLTPYHKNIDNAKDYVFLGSCDMSVNSDMGITLDQDGQLVMIKGCSQNMIKNWYNKYKKINLHNYYLIDDLQKKNHLPFEVLYLDAERKLTGKALGSHDLYTINIESHTSYHSLEETSNIIRISFTKKNETNETDIGHVFSYIDKNGKNVSLEIKNEKIYLKGYGDSDKHTDYSLMEYQIRLPLNEEYKIRSIKPAKHEIQIEVEHKNNKKVFYLDPRDINISKLRANFITHKPPQSLATAIGGDIHEMSNSGQPFSSSRQANFSSKHIPVLSVTIDNFRFHIKKVKQYHCRRKRKKVLAHLLKSIDPGFRAIISTTKNLTKKATISQNNNTSGLIHSNLTNMGQHYASLLKEIPDIITPGTSFTQGLMTILNNIKPNDVISFNHRNHFSSFINLLHTGTPLIQGWFAGLMLSILKTHSVELSTTQDGEIRVLLVSKRNKNLSLLAGTGQGFESKKIHSGDINFLSVMPFEANVILSACHNKEMNISLTMTKENFIAFIDSKNAVNPDHETYRDNLKNAVIKIIDEKQCALSLDMKITELRAMIGIQPTENMTSNLPRFSGGLSLNTELISYTKKSKHIIAGTDDQFTAPDKESKIHFLTATAGVTAGAKFILNPYIADDSEKLNFRTSLTEDNQSRKKKSAPLYKISLPNNHCPEKNNTESKNDKYLKQLTKKLEKIETNLNLCRPIEHLSKIRFNRPLRHTPPPFHIKVLKRCLGGKTVKKYESSALEIEEHHEVNFISSMKKIQQDALIKERTSINKSRSHYFDASYELDNASCAELNALQEALSTFAANQEGTNIDIQRLELEQIHQRIIQLQVTAQYRLKTLKFRCIGELSKVKATLINVIVNFHSKKTLSYNQLLGTLTFEYRNKNDLRPQHIQGNYHTIF